jgi:hypothetical protein
MSIWLASTSVAWLIPLVGKKLVVIKSIGWRVNDGCPGMIVSSQAVMHAQGWFDVQHGTE